MISENAGEVVIFTEGIKILHLEHDRKLKFSRYTHFAHINTKYR